MSSTRHKSSARSASSSASGPSPSELFLEISRGKTAQPQRPIQGDRFLIGSGEWCDLCLGGKNIPTLHSVIHLDGEQIWIDAVSNSPELKIDGEVTSFAELTPGAEISIGSFKLTLRRNSAKKAAELNGQYRVVPADESEEFDDRELGELSASELVDLIESEMVLVEEIEQRKQRGAAALMDAIRRHGSTQPESIPEVHIKPQPLPVLPRDPSHILSELEAAVHSLNRLAQDLERRSHHMSRTEASKAASALLEVQEQVVDRLDEVLGKVAALQRPQLPNQHRDVA